MFCFGFKAKVIVFCFGSQIPILQLKNKWILEYILKMREEKLGTANPDVDDEKKRLFELLKEAGRVRNRKGKKSLENLIDSNSLKMKKEGKKRWAAFGLRT